MNDIDTLRAAILARHPSVYAFCKANAGKISKSVVVLLLAGKYPGNVERQTAKLWGIVHGLPGTTAQAADAKTIAATLEAVACRMCGVKRKKKKQCRQCQAVFRAQAAVLAGIQEEGE